MRKTLVVSIGASVALFLIHAAFAPIYETGLAQISSSLLYVCFAVPFIGVLLHRAWAWLPALMISGIYPLIHLPFFPTAEFYGARLWQAQVLNAAGIAVCLLNLVLMWLHKRNTTPRGAQE